MLGSAFGDRKVSDPATNAITTIWAQTPGGDMNGDGIADIGVILVRQQGGSGIFYYAALALGSADGNYRSSNDVFLGDRIAPQNAIIDNGQFVINYADRKPSESFTTPPSVGKTKFLVFKDGLLQDK